MQVPSIRGGLDAEKADLWHADYEPITVAGPEMWVSGCAAYAHG
jgi:hypothetical protein